jgi:CBS-domain-containing membrane protein
MTKNPVALAADDDCALASTAIREYRLKSLPVVERKDNRKLVGCLRLRRVMAYVFHELGNETRFLGAKPPETEKEPEPMKA